MQLLIDEAGPAVDQIASFDSSFFVKDPFPVVSDGNALNLGTDRNTRVMVFVSNLPWTQNDPATAAVVHLVDSNRQTYDVPAESVRAVANNDFMQVIFRLPNNLAVGTCTVTITAHGQTSNNGSFRIRN
jgi:hypothetical protein